MRFCKTFARRDCANTNRAAAGRQTRLMVLVAALASACVAVHAGSSNSSLFQPSQQTSIAVHAVMEAVTAVGPKKIVAVGERGIVLLSDDGGKTWRQAHTPVSVTLVAVQFVDGSHGWAVGHAGVVLHTEDGGEHWRLQLDGVRAAALALQEAASLSAANTSVDSGAVSASEAAGREGSSTGGQRPSQAVTSKVLRNAQRLVKEGADKPFLSLYFSDALHGTVVGAYGLAVHTDDGGRSWQSWTARMGDERSLHLYAIRQKGSDVWLAGEQGFIVHSSDGGRHFAVVNSSYKGSFFALGIGSSGQVVVGGLRGSFARSIDGGTGFESLRLDGPASIVGISSAPDGRWLILNQTGQIFIGSDTAAKFTPLIEHPSPGLNDITVSGDRIVGAGFEGPRVVSALPGFVVSGDTDAKIRINASGANP